jgi:RNA polymerase sigma factor (sigma-70 family)
MSAKQLDGERETRLILENMGLVISLAKKFQPPTSSELEEYIQVGSIGLLKAIRKYDPKKASLSTWAHNNIRWEIIRYINSKSKKHISLSDVAEPECDIIEDSLIERLPESLTEEEQSVLMLLKANYKLKEISTILEITQYSVSKILNNCFTKIRTANETN